MQNHTLTNMFSLPAGHSTTTEFLPFLRVNEEDSRFDL